MPLQQGYTTRDGERKGYYRWGDSGKRYIYTPGDDEDRERAKEKGNMSTTPPYFAQSDDFVSNSTSLRARESKIHERSLRVGLVRVLALDRSIVLYYVGGQTALGVIVPDFGAS
ncbi:hypothetical protein ACEU6E_02795 [Halorutilales archaeon Cl-col2-1]